MNFNPSNYRVSNNPGNLLELFFLLEILEIFWLSLLVVITTHNSRISKCIGRNIWFRIHL